MIINKTYDKTLWLMLCSDRINRKRIIDFLNVIPIDLYNKIRVALGFYVVKENNFSINKSDELYKSYFNGEVKTSGDMKYWYMIDSKTGALSLGEKLLDGECEYDFFHMVIYPFDDRILKNDSYNDYFIGEITTGYLDDYSLDKFDDTIKFHLISFSFCDIVVSLYSENRNKYRFVDIDKIPDKYSLSNLKDEDSVKKLIRGKKI